MSKKNQDFCPHSPQPIKSHLYLYLSVFGKTILTFFSLLDIGRWLETYHFHSQPSLHKICIYINNHRIIFLFPYYLCWNQWSPFSSKHKRMMSGFCNDNLMYILSLYGQPLHSNIKQFDYNTKIQLLHM